MIQSGPLKENSPPLSSIVDQNKIKTLDPSVHKEQLEKESASWTTEKQGKH
jgi:hypothetical protein